MTGNFILSVVADVPLSRPASGSDKAFNLYFKIKMPQTANVIKVELPENRTQSDGNTADITLTTVDAADYTLHSVDASTGALTTITTNSKTHTGRDNNASPPVPRNIVFTAQNQIANDTLIQIGIKGTIKPKSQPTGNETFGPFKVIIGTFNEERTIQITPNSGSSSQASSTSAIELQNAINTITKRLNDMAPGDAGRTELLQAQSALVTVLAYTYGTVKEAGKVFDSEALYNAQITAMAFIKKERERAASNAIALKEDNSNKRRMAQINTYYTRNYEANTEVMKNIIFISVALIILAILRNKELIPASISTLGVILILMLGGIVIGSQVFDIIRRNDHDFDKYDWTFNEKEHNDKKFIQSDTANLSELGMGMAPCFGASCCNLGTSWDEATKKCIPLAGGLSGTAAWTTTQSGVGTLTISLTVPRGLAAASGGAAADTVTIKLPSGLFSGTPVFSGSGFTLAGSSTVSAPLIFTKSGSPDIATASIASIVITGLTVASASKSKQLTVKTSKDINVVGITITGIP
jgi:hypothetical protein